MQADRGRYQWLCERVAAIEGEEASDATENEAALRLLAQMRLFGEAMERLTLWQPGEERG